MHRSRTARTHVRIRETRGKERGKDVRDVHRSVYGVEDGLLDRQGRGHIIRNTTNSAELRASLHRLYRQTHRSAKSSFRIKGGGTRHRGGSEAQLEPARGRESSNSNLQGGEKEEYETAARYTPPKSQSTSPKGYSGTASPTSVTR
jgi:hypothetical protein